MLLQVIKIIFPIALIFIGMYSIFLVFDEDLISRTPTLIRFDGDGNGKQFNGEQVNGEQVNGK